MSTTEFYPEGRDPLPNSHYALPDAGDQTKVTRLTSRAIAERAAAREARLVDVSNTRDQGPFTEVDGAPDRDDDLEPDATDFAPDDPEVQVDPEA